jgi:hypothetical protein
MITSIKIALLSSAGGHTALLENNKPIITFFLWDLMEKYSYGKYQIRL